MTEPPAHGPGVVAEGARDRHRLPAAAESGELQSGPGHAAGQRHEDEQSRGRVADRDDVTSAGIHHRTPADDCNKGADRGALARNAPSTASSHGRRLKMNPIPPLGVTRRVLLSSLATLPVLAGALDPTSALAQSTGGLLQSWNDGPAKQAIFDFVRTTT